MVYISQSPSRITKNSNKIIRLLKTHRLMFSVGLILTKIDYIKGLLLYFYLPNEEHFDHHGFKIAKKKNPINVNKMWN